MDLIIAFLKQRSLLFKKRHELPARLRRPLSGEGALSRSRHLGGSAPFHAQIPVQAANSEQP